MKCSICDSSNIINSAEKVDDTFQGERYVYIEEYMICNNCGYCFVTYTQSTNNLFFRTEGKC